MERDVMPLFGGYYGYRHAPLYKVRKHQLLWLAIKEYEAEQRKRQAEKDKELQDRLDELTGGDDD
jgi:hypothetical protein